MSCNLEKPELFCFIFPVYGKSNWRWWGLAVCVVNRKMLQILWIEIPEPFRTVVTVLYVEWSNNGLTYFQPRLSVCIKVNLNYSSDVCWYNLLQCTTIHLFWNFHWTGSTILMTRIAVCRQFVTALWWRRCQRLGLWRKLTVFWLWTSPMRGFYYYYSRKWKTYCCHTLFPKLSYASFLARFLKLLCGFVSPLPASSLFQTSLMVYGYINVYSPWLQKNTFTV